MISMMSRRMVRAGLVAAALAISSLPFGSASAAEKWDLYVYNAVSTVSAVKGLNTVIEQIESPGDRSPYGQPIRFHVRVAGIHPEKGFVELKALASGLNHHRHIPSHGCGSSAGTRRSRA